MARIKLPPPGTNLFNTRIPVRITDINYGSHLGNDALVSIIHEARVQWLAAFGFSELDIGCAALIMADLAIEYKAEAFYGDILSVGISVTDIQKISFDIFYEIAANRGERTILIARAKTGMVGYDYAVKKVAALPGKFLEFLAKT